MSHSDSLSPVEEKRWHPRMELYALCALGIAAAMLFAGCGSTIPPTYSGCNATNSGCYGVVHWTNQIADFGGKTLQGAQSSIKIANLTCNAACQAENGFIGNYILIADTGLQHWVEVGFRADVVGTLHFFAADNLLGTGVNFHTLGIVPLVDVGHFDNFSLNHISSTVIEYRISGPGTFGYWGTPPTSFSLGGLEFGQIIHGTQGTGAELGYTCVNHFTDVLLGGIATTPTIAGDFPDSVTSNGVVINHAPPWARWIDTPAMEQGGDFGTDT